MKPKTRFFRQIRSPSNDRWLLAIYACALAALTSTRPLWARPTTASATTQTQTAAPQSPNPPPLSLRPSEVESLKRRIEALEDSKARVEALEESNQRRLEWSGSAELMLEVYGNRGPSSQSSRQAYFYSHLLPKASIASGVSAMSNILFRADGANSARNAVRLDEAYISAKVGDRINLRGGKIIYTWGSSSIYSPTDLINPLDFYDFTHVDKLGAFAVDLTFTASRTISFQFGVLPVFEPSVIADPGSRWLDYSQALRAGLLPKLSLPAGLPNNFDVNFALNNSRVPTNPQVFARANFNLPIFDLSLLYSYRYNPIPSDLLFSSSSTFDVISNRPLLSIQGIPFYSQEHIVGADLSVPVLGSVLFADATTAIPANTGPEFSTDQLLSELNNIGISSITADTLQNSKPSPYTIFAAGIRKDWSRLHIEIEYAKVVYLGSQRPGALFSQVLGASGSTGSLGITPASIYDLFSGAVIPGLTWNMNTRFYSKGGGIWNLSNRGFLSYLELGCHFTDAATVSAAYTLINGASDSLFGYYNSNSNLSVALNASF